MSTFSYPITIRNLLTGAYREVQALVDSGSTFTMAPASLLGDLGVEPVRSVELELADGSSLSLPIGYAEVEVDGEATVALCTFGAEAAEPVLGATSMESLLIAPDPVNHRFIKVRGLLYGAGANGRGRPWTGRPRPTPDTDSSEVRGNP